MALRNVTILTCDKCKAEMIVGAVAGWRSFEIFVRGRNAGGHDICPACLPGMLLAEVLPDA